MVVERRAQDVYRASAFPSYLLQPRQLQHQSHINHRGVSYRGIVL
jgi:hypothetical protein